MLHFIIQKVTSCKYKAMITTNTYTDKHLFEEYLIVSFVACVIISMAELKFLLRVSKVCFLHSSWLSLIASKICHSLISFPPTLTQTRRGKAAKRREWIPGIIFYPMLLLRWLLIPLRRQQIQHNKYPQGHFHFDENKPHSLHRQNAFDMYA